MRSDLLISTQPFDFDLLEEIFGGLGKVYRGSEEMLELQIQTSIGMFRFWEYDPDSENFYEILLGDSGPEEFAKVKALGENLCFLLFSYDYWPLSDVVFMRFPVKGATLVQSEDDGLIRSIEEVRRNIQSRGSEEFILDSESREKNEPQ
jgi:hypothetical protein